MPSVQREPGSLFSHDVTLRTTGWGTTVLRGGAFLLGMIAPVVLALQLPVDDAPADESALVLLGWTVAAFGPVAVVTALLLWRPRTRDVGRIMLFGVSFPFLACLLTVVYALLIGWDSAAPATTPHT